MKLQYKKKHIRKYYVIRADQLAGDVLLKTQK